MVTVMTSRSGADWPGRVDEMPLARIPRRMQLSRPGQKRRILAGFLVEACVSFSAQSALDEGFDAFVVADACGGLTLASHELALRRLEQAGAR